MNDTGANALFLLLMLVLPLSALFARRIPLRNMLKMVAVWIAIFAVVLLLVAGRDWIGAGWSAVTRTIGDNRQNVSGDSVRIAKADDGHFWATAEINGVRRRMLIDSGATETAISAATAAAAHLDLDESPFGSVLSTANGDIAVTRSSVRDLRVGTITARDLPVVVSPAFGDTDILGMNFLSQLRSWRVEGDVLILDPQPAHTS
ncbi:MAG: retropepsin-like aspartic protease family protein [Sphingomonas sp.]